MEIYFSTAGINLPMYYGTTISPIFADMILNKSSLKEREQKGKILFNCHTPHFLTAPPEEEIIELLDERKSEYERLRISGEKWEFKRDDQTSEEFFTLIEQLYREDLFYNEDGNPFFDISAAKKRFIEKGTTPRFFPEFYKQEFQEYLQMEEEPQPIRGKLEYGLSLSPFGSDAQIGQVWEQALFPSLSSEDKIILSGPNVLGPYTYRALLIDSLFNDAKNTVAVHSLSKARGSIKQLADNRGRVSLKDLVELSPEMIDPIDFVRYLSATSITDKKNRILGDDSIIRARKTLNKYGNLRKCLEVTKVEPRNEEVHKAMKSVFGITDRLFANTHATSRAFSQREDYQEAWENSIRDYNALTGRKDGI